MPPHLELAKHMDQLEKFLIKVVDNDDVSDFMEEDHRVFTECEKLDEFEQLRQKKKYYRQNGEKLDGFWEKLMGEMYEPMDATNDQCEAWTHQLLVEWATGMLHGLQKNMSEYLTSKDGKYSVKNQTDLMKEICENTVGDKEGEEEAAHRPAVP